MPAVARVAGVAAAAVAACSVSPVAWEEPEVLDAPETTMQLVIEPSGAPALITVPPASATWEPEGACTGSARYGRGADGEVHAVWWAPRQDGSAALLARRSQDGGASWEPFVPVDTMDRARLGCDRPPAAITVDDRTGYVHIAYFLHGPHGPGIFFSHSMERGTFYHAPVPIVYGERPSAVAIASEGSAVAIAYQDPNTSAPRVSLALSSTDGHLFELRLPRISSGSAAADRPLVDVRGDRVAVAWRARPVNGTGEGVTMVRVGAVHWECRPAGDCDGD